MAPVARSDDMRKGNRQRVLSILRRAGTLSRTDIAALTGLSAATISAITADLLAENTLRPDDTPGLLSASRGRPKIALTFNPEVATVGAVVLHLNSVASSIADYTGTVLAEDRREVDTLSVSRADLRRALVASLKSALDKVEARHGPLRRIAVSVQGITDVAGSVLSWSPITHHTNLPIPDWITSDFGVPARLSNDCDLLARALNWRDPERYQLNFAVVMLSHGVGMGLFLRGGIINGTVSSGSEFGHVMHLPGGALCRCGSRGCIEAYAADYAIERRAMGTDPASPPPGLVHCPDIAAIAAAARRGDKAALRAIEEAGEAVGFGLAGVFALVDPFPVVLVGSVTRASEIMEPAIRNALGRTMAGQTSRSIAIDWIADEQPLIREGAALNALLALDEELAAFPGGETGLVA